jgi:hypothetical protein
MNKFAVIATVCLMLGCAISVSHSAQTPSETSDQTGAATLVTVPTNSCPADTPAWPIYKSLSTEATKEVATSLAVYRLFEGEFRFCNAGGYGLDARLLMESPSNRANGFVFCGEAVNYADNGITSSSQGQVKSDATSHKAAVFEWYYGDKSPRSTPQAFSNNYNNTGRPQYIVGEVVTGYVRALIGSDPKLIQQECLKMTQDLADEEAADVLKQRNAHQRP